MQPFHLVSKYLICYGLFFLLTYLTRLNDGLKLFDEKGPVRNPAILIGLHIAGIFWLGLIPVNILTPSFRGIVFGKTYPDIWQWTVLFAMLIITVVIAYTQTIRFTMSNTNEKAFTLLNRTLIYKYFFLRIIFLVVYEVWFRGYLLSDSIAWFGVLLAIIINTALYVLLHIFGNRKEIVACVPFGIAMCGLCIWFGAAWPAIVLHITIAMVYETTLLKKFLTLQKTLHPISHMQSQHSLK